MYNLEHIFTSVYTMSALICRLLFSIFGDMETLNMSLADPGGRAVVAGVMGLRACMFFLLCLYVVLVCVSRGLCDGLITRTEESYSVCLIVCD
jgi:hypothetical protein